MNNIDHFYDYFKKYGSTPTVDVDYDHIPISMYGISSSIYSRTTITISFRIYSGNDFERFQDDLFLARAEREAEKIRRESPIVQKAYEEYQLLLKLLK
jgi:hypothetical protein